MVYFLTLRTLLCFIWITRYIQMAYYLFQLGSNPIYGEAVTGLLDWFETYLTSGIKLIDITVSIVHIQMYLTFIRYVINI